MDKKRIAKLVAFVVSSAILIGAVALAYHWLTTKPKGGRRHYASAKPPLVKAVSPVKKSLRIEIETFGTVAPYRTQKLGARISSRVDWVSPKLLPGSFVRSGEDLILLDKSDLVLELPQKRFAIKEAELKLRDILQKRAVAEYELGLSDLNLSTEEREYIVQKPQIETAKASLEAAKAQLQKVLTDIERARVSAPFDALVLSVDVAEGDIVKESSPLATLARADRFLIKASLAPSKLSVLQIPGYNSKHGSRVRIRHDFWPIESFAEGEIEGIEAAVDPQAKTATLVIAAKNPLKSEKHPPLLLEGFVELTIVGVEIPDAVEVPAYLFENGDRLLCVDSDNKIRIKRVDPIYRGKSRYILSAESFEEDEKIVLTHLENPIEGMRVRIEDVSDRKRPL